MSNPYLYTIRETGYNASHEVGHDVFRLSPIFQEVDLLASGITLDIVRIILTARVLPRDAVRWETSLKVTEQSGLEFLQEEVKSYLADLGA